MEELTEPIGIERLFQVEMVLRNAALAFSAERTDSRRLALRAAAIAYAELVAEIEDAWTS